LGYQVCIPYLTFVERACSDRLEFRLKPRRYDSNAKAGPGFQG
jgi:hypothetical protein